VVFTHSNFTRASKIVVGGAAALGLKNSNKGSTKMKVFFKIVILAFTLILAITSGYAAEKQEKEAEGEEVVTSKPLTLTETYTLTNTLPRQLIDLRKQLSDLTSINRIFSQIQKLSLKVEELEWETTTTTTNPNLNSHELLSLDTKLTKVDSRIAKLNKRIKSNIQTLEILSNAWSANELQLNKFKTQTTGQINLIDALPTVESLEQITTDAQKLLDNKIRPTLLAGKQLGEIQARNYALHDKVSDLLDDMNDSGFQQTAPSMFSKYFYSRYNQKILQQSRDDLLLFASYQIGYLKNNLVGVFSFLAVIVLVVFLTRMSGSQVKASHRWHQFVDKPIATGVFIVSITFVLIEAIYVDISLPPNWQVLLQIPMIIAAVFLVGESSVISKAYRKIVAFLIYSLAVIMFFGVINWAQPIIHLCVLGSSCWALLYLLRHFSKRKRDASKRNMIFLDLCFVLFLLIVFLAGVSGYEQVADLIFDRGLSILVITLIVWLMYKIVSGLLELILFALPVPIIRQNAANIVSDIAPVLILAHVVLWFLLALSYLTIFPTVDDALSALISLQFSAFSHIITPKSILVVVCAMYVTVLSSRGINAFLIQDILPRYRVTRGVQESITRLVHYGILVIGFMILMKLLGFKFGDIAIIGGALGVGIGFGLKEIVNNFVSGLILLFERPVKVGDIIVVGQDMGEVTSLGLRATTVQTYDNAEIVIPNAELITCSVTNWTLAEKRVRVKIPVGVAYGTDISSVLKILLSCADLNPTVLTKPPPSALFLVFGDSSLNFELRVWISDINDRMRVLSELNQDIENEFQIAGIEIPFPQRDLHLKSVDVDSIKAFQQATTDTSAV
jgi:potassium efflux system protein